MGRKRNSKELGTVITFRIDEEVYKRNKSEIRKALTNKIRRIENELAQKNTANKIIDQQNLDFEYSEKPPQRKQIQEEPKSKIPKPQEVLQEKKKLRAIYEEFKEFIDPDNEVFKEFLTQDKVKKECK